MGQFDDRARLLVVLAALLALPGCETFVAGTTATTAAVSSDPRNTGTVVQDQAIESRTNDFYKADAQLSQNCHLNVTSFNEILLLSGECPTEDLRARADEYAKRVAKVRHVHNEITIGAPSAVAARSADGIITTKVKAKLLSITDLQSGNIKVVTEARIVYLMGVIDRHSGDAAAEAAAGLGGVDKVVKLFEYPG